MDLAKVLIARSIRLFDLEEINPRGKKIEAAYQAIKDRYHFTQSPLEGAQKGVKFTGGRFNPGEGDVDIELDFYADGIVATSRSDTQRSRCSYAFDSSFQGPESTCSTWEAHCPGNAP
jgi:hypothetical protein